MSRLSAKSSATAKIDDVNGSLLARSVYLVIYGHLYSAKNTRIPTRGFIMGIKNPKAQAFERAFLSQVLPQHQKELGSKQRPLRSIVTVYYPSRRQDLSCELVYDLLQKAHVIVNDRFIREKHEYGEVDVENPRVEITVEEM